MITKWLKDRTQEEREKDIQTLIAMPLKKVRHYRDVASASKQKAFEMYTADKNSEFRHKRDYAENKFDPIFENIDLMQEDYMEAIGRKCFPDMFPSKESDRLKRFQASGSDAPAPVPMYERSG